MGTCGNPSSGIGETSWRSMIALYARTPRLLVARTILRMTLWTARSTGCRAGRSPKNGGGLFGSGITVLRPTAGTGTPSRSATSFSTYMAPSQKKMSKANSSRIFLRSVKWWSTWDTKNCSRSKAISFGPLSRARSGYRSFMLPAITSVAAR